MRANAEHNKEMAVDEFQSIPEGDGSSIECESSAHTADKVIEARNENR
jgi:hypothetical protein